MRGFPDVMTPTRRRSRATAVPDTLARARALIQKSGNIRTGLENLRRVAEPNVLLRVAADLAALPAYRPLVWPRPRPTSFADIPERGSTYFHGYAKELAWAAGSLLPHAPALSRFIELRRDFDRATLCAPADEADALLEEIERAFGVSLWLLEARLNLFQRRKQAGAMRDYVARRLQLSSVSPLVRYLASWLAYKSQAGVSAAEVRRLLPDDRELDGIDALVRALMGDAPAVTPRVVGQMMAVTDALPVIDRYLVLLLGQQLLAAGSAVPVEEAAMGVAAIGALARRIPDPQLALLLPREGSRGVARMEGEVVRLFDDYVEGRYGEVASAVEALPSERISVEAVALGVRAATLAGRTLGPLSASGAGSVLTAIAEDLGSVIAFGGRAPEAGLRLQKLQLTHCNAAWASSLAIVLERQRNDDRAFEPTSAQRVHALRSTLSHPDFGFCLPRSRRTAFFGELVADHPGSVGIAALAAVLAEEDFSQAGLAPGRSLRLAGMGHARHGRWAEAALLLETACATEAASTLQVEASLILLHCYLEQGRLADCAALAVRLHLSSDYVGSVLPIARLVDELVKVHDEPMSTSPTRGLISVAIVYDIYSRYVGPDRDAERADAFKDVLRRAGVAFASELAGQQQSFDPDQLVYFWRHVCVPDVLDQSLALQTTRAVEDERAAILVALSDVIAGRGGSQPADLKDELREIRTRQVVRETTLRLDQSKVYVNVEGIRRALDVSMRDAWHRYRILCMQGGGLGDFQELERILRAAASDRVRFVMLNAGDRERGKLLARMVGEVMDMFAYSKEFGLDSNLSTNIRHGYVLRELRSPLVARKLITNRSSSSGDYQPNSFWIDRLLGGIEEERLTGPLDRFSRRVDDIIDHVNRRLLRIRSPQLPEGLFVYPQQDELRVADVESRCADLETHEQFMDVVFEQCWLITERNLVRVRAELEGGVLDSLGRALGELQGEVNAAGLGYGVTTALTSAITLARSDIRSAVNRVASWFTVSGNNEYQDYDLQIAFEAGLKTVKTYYSNVGIDSSLTIAEPVVLRGWTLPIFARLFFLLLDNAAQHGAAEREELEIVGRIELGGDSLLIRVENDLPAGYDEQALRRRVEAINADYGRDKASELLRQEGGSGYPKMWKLLNFDLRRVHDLDVSLTEDRFVVEVLVDVKGLM